MSTLPGRPALNIIKMARTDLAPGLSVAISRAIKENAPVLKEGLRVVANGQKRYVNVNVIPIKGAAGHDYYYLVVFEEATLTSSDKGESPHCDKIVGEREEQPEMEQELAATKEYLHSVVEQYESANEELRTANEEIQSSNEELQSMNEYDPKDGQQGFL